MHFLNKLIYQLGKCVKGFRIYKHNFQINYQNLKDIYFIYVQDVFFHKKASNL